MGAEGCITALIGGRRRLDLEVGPISVAVTEIPGRSVTNVEWRESPLARRAWRRAWGGGLTTRWGAAATRTSARTIRTTVWTGDQSRRITTSRGCATTRTR